jgi:hypothetical protein
MFELWGGGRGGIEARGDGFGKDQQAGADILDRPAQEVDTPVQIGGDVVGDHGKLGPGHDNGVGGAPAAGRWTDAAHGYDLNEGG